ncbi:hypothetical protein VE01_03417 [Pseudogymnoascus verrucosus]|uniref:C2H2-type domain-containing protein n=1 Tax=Pseudogymnoascus verrucosus TaxID=342668 RepID=A0A1B8GSS2_9PEZI|nr:uncharacterized protein VE01_03417 [Pseudogymnoascus verrucosus]OBT98850.1 hypothetical protein VE01_03417 [Pseudogymnoascus verrucosus]
MSSSVASGATPSPSIDPRQLDGSSPDYPHHAPAAPLDAAYLSSYQYQHYSSSSSPSALTPGNPVSENSGYSEFSDYGADEFFGVNFDADGQDLIIGSDSQGPSPPQTTGLGFDPLLDNEATPDTPPAVTAPLMTPDPTRSRKSSPNSNRPPAVKTFIPRVSAPEDGLNSASSPSSFNLSVNTAEQQATPDMSGNTSHTSAEGVPNSMGAFAGHSPRVTLTTWNSTEERELSTDPEDQGTTVGAASERGLQGYFAPRDAEHSSAYNIQISVAKSSNGSSVDDDEDEGGARRGFDPVRRKSFSDAEIPNFKDRARSEEIEAKRREVEEWRSQAGDSSDEQDDSPTRPPLSGLSAPAPNRGRSLSTGAVPHSQNSPRGFSSWAPEPPHIQTSALDAEAEEDNIRPVSPTASIRENRLQDGQTYFNKGASNITDEDVILMQQSRHFSDAATFPNIVSPSIEGKGTSAKEMMEKWNAAADSFSIISRSATWGTRRRRLSAPSVKEIEAITSGGLLKRLSFGKGNEKKPGILSTINNAFGNVVRKKSVGEPGKLKRNRNIDAVDRGRPPSSPLGKKENNTTSTLAPPRSPSGTRVRPQSPRLTTSFGRELTPGDGGHSRRASVGSTNSVGGFFTGVGNAIRRSRSKSELSTEAGLTGIAGQWMKMGGPPVPTLTSPPIDADEEYGLIDDQPMHDVSDMDLDADDDDDDDLADDGDLQFDLDTPIVATMDGFRDHVRKLNPMMEPGYLVDRLAHQQMVRYKCLLGWRIKHQGAISDRACNAQEFCLSMGGATKYYEAKAKGRAGANKALPIDGDGSDSNPENALGAESFPDGVPKPPALSLPAEFECQLCFKVKKFLKPSDWTKHVHEDVQPFTCTYPSCREPKSFKRKADWVRHENERHRHLEWWTCQIEDCSHKCYRKDNFLQHLVREHKLPEPKTKSKAAIRRATGVEEEVWARVAECHHETLVRPVDEPCKFCGKAFASWKKLTVHLGKHMEQLSLPVLRLVDQRTVDANTIISPVEALPVRNHHPLTPTGPQSGGPGGNNLYHGQGISPPFAHFPPGMAGFPQNGVRGIPDYGGEGMYPNPQAQNMAYAGANGGGYAYGDNAGMQAHHHMQQQHMQQQQQQQADLLRSATTYNGLTPLEHTPLVDQSGFPSYSPHSVTPGGGYAYTSASDISPTPAAYPPGTGGQGFGFVQQQQQHLTPEPYMPAEYGGGAGMGDSFGLGVGVTGGGYGGMSHHGLPFSAGGQQMKVEQTSPFSGASSSTTSRGFNGGGGGGLGVEGLGVAGMGMVRDRSGSGGRQMAQQGGLQLQMQGLVPGQQGGQGGTSPYSAGSSAGGMGHQGVQGQGQFGGVMGGQMQGQQMGQLGHQGGYADEYYGGM